MPTNTQVSSDIDTLLRLPSKVAVQDYLGVDDNAAGVAANAAAILLKAPILNATFEGTTTIPSADITTADFNDAGLGGELSWNNQEKTLDLITGSDNVTIQLGQEVVLYARNNSGATLSDGNVVGISGSQGSNPTIQLVQADTVESARKTIGVVTQIIPNNSNGFVTLLGKVRDLVFDDGTYSEGDVVYLSDTVAGGITNVKPAIVVELGHVLATSNGNNKQGVLEVQVNNESAVYELEQQVPHNTDSVIICNQGDNIQDKYDEAAALTPNGNPLSSTNLASLIVMGGTYADLDLSNINNVTYVSIIGIGKVNLVVFEDGQTQSHYGDFKNFQCELFSLYQSTGTIENITVIPLGSDFEVFNNAGTIRNVSSPHVTINENTGTVENVITTGQWYQDSNSGEIKNCSAAEMLEYSDNSGIIDNCHSTGTLTRAFCAHIGYSNSGTIKNCTARGARSFGEQTATGVTENCKSELQGFGATSSQITSGGGAGTYKNCAAGVGSFFGINSDTTIIRTMLANYIDCTAGQQSFGHVNVLAAETVFSGTATNCTAGFRSFASVGTTGGAASISADAVIENCSAGNFSFGSITNADNFGKVLRCRTTQLSNPFKASGTTGVVRLGLDGNYNVVNIPVTAWPT
jgi:hypothetical protein